MSECDVATVVVAANGTQFSFTNVAVALVMVAVAVGLSFWQRLSLERDILLACLRAFIDSEGLKIGDVIHALRVAVTGKPVGLGMFDCLTLLGRERVLARIDQTLRMLA